MTVLYRDDVRRCVDGDGRGVDPLRGLHGLRLPVGTGSRGKNGEGEDEQRRATVMHRASCDRVPEKRHWGMERRWIAA
jgi:hypothetical protein